jgi:CRISPR-associated protein (TIGR03986 family)
MAIAPYNFVPLPEKVLTVDAPVGHDRFEGLSGYIDCEITTSSPMFIRGMLIPNDFANGKQSKDNPNFFSFDKNGKPRIPGSSLRGLFRSIFEIITYSKPYAITDKKLIYRSVGDITSHGKKYRGRLFRETSHNQFEPLIKSGFMRIDDGDWFIQPSIERDGATFARIPNRKIPKNLIEWHGRKNSSLIFVNTGENKFQEIKGGFIQIKFPKVMDARTNEDSKGVFKEGVLARSGRMFSKESEAIIYPPDPKKGSKEDWIPVSRDQVDNYRDQLSDEQTNLLGESGVLRDFFPVFYLIENGDLVFFGHCQIFRIPYQKSPWNLVDPKLKDNDSLDMAQSLFGFIQEKRKDNNQALAGRICFSDAICTSKLENVYEKTMTPKVLATPKPTTFQHYVNQPNPDFVEELHDYDEPGATIRGNKLYWHKGDIPVSQIEETDEKKLKHKTQYTRITPVKNNVEFSFRITFNNLAHEELGAILWILTKANDSQYRLKIGMGKPLGMGAISAKIREVNLVDRVNHYKRLFSTKGTSNSLQWFYGEPSTTITNKVIQDFLDWVLVDPVISAGHTIKEFDNLPRIKTLLKILSWPGPDSSFTRYLEIERPDSNARRGKRNEYDKRPVLSDPFNITGNNMKEGYPPQEKKEDVIESTISRSQKLIAPPARRNEQPKIEIPEERESVSPFSNEFKSFIIEQSKTQDKKEKDKKKKPR